MSPDGRFVNEIASFIESQKSISLKPSDYSLLGNIFFYKKDYKKSAYYYRIENNIKKYYALGYSLFRTNNKSDAVHYLKEYAYNFPKSKNARWALYYAGACTPSYMRKSFWEKATKDIPTLAYYTIYKEALSEEYPRKRVKLLNNFIAQYPNCEFTLDAVWEIMWQKILDKDFNNAEEIGKKYFNSISEISETRAKVGFWLGKIAEIKNQKDKATEYYKLVKDLLPDNYYSHRASGRLMALTGAKDENWKLQSSINDFENFTWSIPSIIKPETLKRHFGATIAELISLQEFDEAIDLIGKSNFPSKQITSWLKALNNEYETSINTASSLITAYNLKQTSPVWELAYPLHFWQYVKNTCKKYNDLDPLFVCGLIRQESRFEANATSISNAYGLMQLIFPTAKTVSRQLNFNLNSSELLFNPKVNIELGANYINGLLKDFSNPLFAVASYNAGPNATKQWISNFRNKDLDFFVEEIPYEQTRTYVKKVFSSYWTYLMLYKK
ncbi:MAG: transglycosylase SLT domain-containing protein [Candidatus Melainabacteria bacterium]|nr:transglycosylase SLT domain-containing protein [Candidatus Melainabacteria bacterium]